MENIVVKVIYKGKIVIIGKGIRTQQSIINELQKRFNIPESQIALFYLQYDDNCKDINQAYSKAYSQGKQSIRIKIQLARPEDKFIEMKSYHPVLLKKNHQEQINIQNESPHVVFEQTIRRIQSELSQTQQHAAERKSNDITNNQTVVTNQHIIEVIQQVPNDNSSYIPLVTQLNQMNFNRQNNKISMQKIQVQDEQSEENTLLPLKKNQKITYPDLQDRVFHNDYDQQSRQHLDTYQNHSSIHVETQNTQPINNIRQQIRKQFYDKLMLLEKRQLILEQNNQELQTKYNDLLEKYHAVVSILQQTIPNSQSKQLISEKKQQQKEQQKKPQIQGYQKLPNFDPFQHILNHEDYLENEPQVEIKDLNNKDSYSVGQVIKPQFFIVNTGSQKWPENVVLVSQSDVVKIKSLEPNEEDILQLKDITVEKQNAQIKEKYSLGYYNQKGELKYFGHRFGVRAKIVNKEILKDKQKNQFNYYIHQLMTQNHIFEKDLKDVVNFLKSIGLNEKNYKQAEKSHLIDVINYME